MKRWSSILISGFLGCGLFSGLGAANAQQQPAASAAASAEVKVGTGYERYQVVGEAASFPVGTLVFAVSRVLGAEGTTVRHVWKQDGVEVWSASLDIGAKAWTTSSRRRLTRPGSYEVAVIAADGSELGKLSFTVQ